MNNKRRILIFIAFVTVLISAAWQFIESRYFGRLASNYVSKKIESQYQIKLNFTDIDIDIFPLSTVLQNVKLQYSSKENKMDTNIQANTLGAYFSIFDLFSNEVSIHRIEISGANINATSPYLAIPEQKWSASTESTEKNLEEILAHYKKYIYDKLPIQIDEIFITSSLFKPNDSEVWINELGIELDEESFGTSIDIESFSIFNEKIDSLKLYSSANDKNIEINNFEIKQGFESISYVGNLTYQKTWKLDGQAKYLGNAKRLFKKIEKYDEDISSIDGHYDVVAKVKGDYNNPNINLEILAQDFRSNYANAEKIYLSLSKVKDIISLNAVNLEKNLGTIELKDEVQIFNIKTNKIIEPRYKFLLSEFHTNDALYYLKDVISPLKGRINGEIDIIVSNDDITFEIQENSFVKRLDLEFEKNSPILKIPDIKFNKSNFILDYDGNLALNLDLLNGESHVKGSGTIKPDYISISASSEKFSFEKFGPIQDINLWGNGKVNFQVDGPFEDVRMYFDVDVDKFKVINLNLGEVNGKLRLDLKDLNLYLNNVNGRYNLSRYKVAGRIQFEDKYLYMLDIEMKHGMYKDLFSIFDELLPADHSIPKGIALNYSGKYKVGGSLNDETPTINGTVNAKNLTWYNEEADRLSGEFTLRNNILNVKKFELLKRKGSLDGKIKYDFNNDHVDYTATLNKLSLSDIAFYRFANLGYEGILKGSFSGDGNINNLQTKSELRVIDGNIFNKITNETKTVIYTAGKDVFISGNILGNVFVFDSYINLSDPIEKNTKNSYLNLSINSTNVKLLTEFFSVHNVTDNSIRGRVSANLESTFSLSDWEKFNLVFSVDELAFKRDSVRMNIDPSKNSILIKDGEIKYWDLQVHGKKSHAISKGEGKLFDDFEIQNDVSFDSSLLELLFSRVQKSYGIIDSTLKVMSENNTLSSYFTSETDKVYLKLKNIPDAINDITYRIVANDNYIYIPKFNGKFGNGSLSATGSIQADYPYPKVDLKISADQTKINFFKQSNIVASGLLNIKGDKTPYQLEGDLAIINGELLDEFSEYYLGDGTQVDNRFVPKPINVSNVNFFKYNFSINTFTPIHIKNSMADLSFNGSIKVDGDYLNPSFDGELKTIKDRSRFLFKSHEFRLNEGRIYFNEEIGRKVPGISVKAETDIQDYLVHVDVAGKVDKLDIKLSSEPSLSNQDILSLLTLGITSEVANNLDSSDRQSITSLGLGSLIIDQFKLNGGLDSNFGLKLSVLPEIQEDEESLLHGRKTGTSSSTKVKSSTKIKVQTKIYKKVDLSFSSTLGGSINQKQEMNIDYNLNKNLSLQGVYEIEETDNEGKDSSTSVGIDLKFKKTFK